MNRKWEINENKWKIFIFMILLCDNTKYFFILNSKLIIERIREYIINEGKSIIIKIDCIKNRWNIGFIKWVN